MNNNIGLRIKYYRELKHMTQKELADKLGYSDKSSIAKIESGASGVHSFKIVKFADALGCKPEDLDENAVFPIIERFKSASELEEDFSDNVDAILKAESLQNILKMLSEMDTKQIIKVEKVIRTLSED